MALLEDEEGNPTNSTIIFEGKSKVEENGYAVQSVRETNEGMIREEAVVEAPEELIEELGAMVGWKVLLNSEAALAVDGFWVVGEMIRPPYMQEWVGPSLLRFPFPVQLILNVGGGRVSLTTARSEVITDERWDVLEKLIYEIIIKGIKREVEQECWTKLVKAWASVRGCLKFKEVLFEIAGRVAR